MNFFTHEIAHYKEPLSIFYPIKLFLQIQDSLNKFKMVTYAYLDTLTKLLFKYYEFIQSVSCKSDTNWIKYY